MEINSLIDREPVKRMEGQVLDKKQIRREVLAKRNQLTDAERKRGELLITDRILGHQWYYQSRKILAYASYGSELSLDMLLEEVLRSGKELYLPRVLPKSEASFVSGEINSIQKDAAAAFTASAGTFAESTMEFYRVRDLTQLQSGYKGIREPEVSNECYICDEVSCQDTLLIMPGVAFDLRRNRIGYGKGFYDNYLKQNPGLQTRSIAVAFACQIVEEVPAWEQDIKPYQLLTV